MDRERFETMYSGQAPWDIDHAQPEIVALEGAGGIRGAVLDAGCGTGENALFLAARGHEVWGIDFVPAAIERAREKARARGLAAEFRVTDALSLATLGRAFDTVVDCGLFHTFSDEERPRFVAGLEQVLRPGGVYQVLCFSDREPPGEGPRRVSQQEIHDSFARGWEVRSIREARFEAAQFPGAPQFSHGGPRAWLATIVRTPANAP